MSRDFDGSTTSSRIQWLADSPRLLGDMTYCAWIRYDTLAAGDRNNTLASCGAEDGWDTYNYSYAFSIDADGTLRAYWEHGAGVDVDVTSDEPAELSADTWHHVGFVRDAAAKVVHFYADGEPVGSPVPYGDNPGGDGYPAERVVTGKPGGFFGPTGLDGEMAHEATWDRVLSGGEMAHLGGTTPYVPATISSGLVRYHPLTGVGNYELDFVTGEWSEWTIVPKGANDVALRDLFAAGERGTAGVYAPHLASGRGIFRQIYAAHAGAERGRRMVVNPFAAGERGTALAFNTHLASGRGIFRQIYARCTGGERGAARAFNTHLAAGRGAAAVLAAFTAGDDGAGVVYGLHSAADRGGHHMLIAIAAGEAGRGRVANDDLDRYELYRGVDGEPDFAAGPWETFAELPHETAALAAEHEYRFVLRRRNRWGLSSRNVASWRVRVDAAGERVPTPPGGVEDAAAEAVAGGVVRLTAQYAYALDGGDAADTWLVYVRTDGTDPDVGMDTPVAVSMGKADGVARLSHETAAQTEGTVVKAIIAVRRSPGVDSVPSGIVTATATHVGPGSAARAAALLGTVAEQHQ